MLAIGVFAGFLGSLLGLGGGIIVTPIVTVFFGLDIKYAIGASCIVVIATSSGSTIAYLKDNILNLRAAMFLEIFTSVGGICGALFATWIIPQALYAIYACFLVFSCYNMIRKLVQKKEEVSIAESSAGAKRLNLAGSYYDVALKKQIDYNVEKVSVGSAIMWFAGIASGVLGIGSGPFKVIAMDNAMKMPLKVSTSTSNLMMGVTACSSALIYFFGGQILPQVAAPLAIGVLIGAAAGSKVMPHVNPKVIRMIFVPLLLIIAVQMLLKAFGA